MKQSTPLLVAGSIALDTLEGDFGTAPDELGGSALYFALAAALLTPVAIVAAVGRNDADLVREAISGRPIETDGLDVLDAPTFRWHARHVDHGNLDLGHDDRIYDVWSPHVPAGFAGWAFAGSMRPALQVSFLRQSGGAELRASDAMLSYVRSAPAEARDVIAGSHWFFANADELRALYDRADGAGFRLLHELLGLCVKAGPAGATVYTDEGEVRVPALRTRPVVDTTGAGDALAAGFLARRLTMPAAGIGDALEHGVALASITIEDIGLRALRRATAEQLTRRVAEVRAPGVKGLRVEAVRGDITRERVAAVVNAANEALAGGGGVDGAIHRAAGHAELQEACRRLGGCPTGEARATPGFGLQAEWIIHAVGPRWHGGGEREPELLASAYRRSLQVADDVGARSVAFPAISTGIYGYPRGEAARIAVETLTSTPTQVELVRLVAFDAETLALYERELARRAGSPGSS